MIPNPFRSSVVPRGPGRRAAEIPARDAVSYLVFEVDAQPYACPIDKIRHLMLSTDVSLRPNPEDAPPWQVGLLEMRDEPEGIPAVSVRTLWGLPPLTDVSAQQKQAVLIVSIGGRSHALLVDGCRCVLSNLPPGFAKFRFSAALKGVKGKVFHLAMAWGESLLVMLDLDELLQSAVIPGKSSAFLAAKSP